MSNIIHGDCIEELKKLPENSVDAIVTDPPYNLSSIVKRFGKKDSAPAQFGNDGSFNRLSKGFMGKQWDNEIAFGTDIWIEALRVLKPGGYLLSFGGTRTYHRMACAIEDAGFEIRDMISWLYGSGFPKSLNIGKQIDKIQGNKREVIGEKIRGDVEKAKEKGAGYLSDPANRNNEKQFGYGTETLTKGNSEWEGWGTALKPACEPIVVARKPLSEKNVALNVLKWGTGGINIEGCRIPTNPEVDDMLREVDRNKRKSETWEEGSGFKNENNNLTGVRTDGRFPANIILDEEAGQMLDEQSGISKSQGGLTKTFSKNNEIYGDFNPKLRANAGGLKDKCGASRFFYCAKASKSERNYGCEEIKDSNIDYGERMGQNNSPIRPDGTERKPNIQKNNHPTVKPIKLMEYLIKLVSKEGAVVLDPFLGSGTTLLACHNLNRNGIGIEKEEEYVKIAQARLNKLQEQTKLSS